MDMRRDSSFGIRLTRRAALAGAAALPLATARAQQRFKTVEAGFLTVAIAGDMPMTSIKDGALIGSDGEIIIAIAEKLGLKAKPALMEWSATIEAVKSGRADIMLGNMGWTKARSEVVAITDPIYFITRFLLQKKGRNIDSVEALKGLKFGTVNGFTPIPDMRRIPGLGELKLYDTSDACLRDIVAGRLDAAVLDGPTIDYILLRNAAWGLEQVGMKFHPDYPVLTGRNQTVMGLNRDNCDLFHAVNQGVAWIWKQGINKAALERYGLTNPMYLTPVEKHQRIGVDRDEKNAVIGAMLGCQKDFSSLFGA
jgi:polar amino acid transport system substrate-binding protein